MANIDEVENMVLLKFIIKMFSLVPAAMPSAYMLVSFAYNLNNHDKIHQSILDKKRGNVPWMPKLIAGNDLRDSINSNDKDAFMQMSQLNCVMLILMTPDIMVAFLILKPGKTHVQLLACLKSAFAQFINVVM